MPAPTPASQYRLVRPEKLYSQQTFNHLSMNDLKFYKGNDSCDTGEVKVTGNGLVVAHSSPKTMWNVNKKLFSFLKC
ncbi:hypothetical protein Btru_074680 [Bulinus truncatus]|nr:hypothetical protein Btru_074680 [Bulinus truncatus]